MNRKGREERNEDTDLQCRHGGDLAHRGDVSRIYLERGDLALQHPRGHAGQPPHATGSTGVGLWGIFFEGQRPSAQGYVRGESVANLRQCLRVMGVLRQSSTHKVGSVRGANAP